MTPRSAVAAIPLSGPARIAIIVTSLVGLAAFFWPFLTAGDAALGGSATNGPLVFGLLLPLWFALAAALVADGTSSAKPVAMIGVLAAAASALRALGTGIAGLEPIWIVIVLGAYALGAGFGFLLGPVCILASGLLTGGIGPWLPFQMMGAAWVGLGAGALAGRLPGRFEVRLLAGYAVVAAVAYGWLLNLWFWPTVTALPAGMAYVPGAGWGVNLHHWFTFNLATSLGYDVPRAALTATAVLLVGGRVLDSLRRVSRRAAFAAPVVFEPVAIAAAGSGGAGAGAVADGEGSSCV